MGVTLKTILREPLPHNHVKVILHISDYFYREQLDP